MASLNKMRGEGKTIALVQGATGSGKSAIGVLDARSIGKRVLFLAHTKELVEQGVENFEKLWSEVSVGRFYENYHETDTQVVCGSIQSIIRNLDLFRPDDFDYMIIDECHHASAKSYATILSYFRPSFTLGLTATPERADGEDLLEVFQNVAHKLDIKDAVESGVLVPVRCIRVKTNINLTDVRINGFKYNSMDLETTVVVPERNKLIVDTYLEYVKDKSTVIFCTSVDHADKIAELLRNNGVKAESVSGKTENSKRKQILKDYENKKIKVLCACDLLNEGWDSPITEVLFMARPTMSKTIYMQQLGRGMRIHEGKEFLMVFDFVTPICSIAHTHFTEYLISVNTFLAEWFLELNTVCLGIRICSNMVISLRFLLIILSTLPTMRSLICSIGRRKQTRCILSLSLPVTFQHKAKRSANISERAK